MLRDIGLLGLTQLDEAFLYTSPWEEGSSAALLAAVELTRRIARLRIPERKPLAETSQVASYLTLRYQTGQEVLGALFLLDLSNDENDDAVRVLDDGPLGNLDIGATVSIQIATIFNDLAISSTNNLTRKILIDQATAWLQHADNSLGGGTTGFTMGAGNLLF